VFRILATLILELQIMSTHLNKVEYKEVESTNELECRPLMGMKHQ